MFFQLSIEGYEWVVGLGLMFALALVMNQLTFKDLNSFFIWLTIFDGFMVWGGLLPLWTLIICIIVLIIILYDQVKENRGVE